MRRICAWSVAAAGEIVERLVGDADDVVGDELRALARAVLGVLQAALPFQHRPRVVADRRQFREDPAEVDLPVAERAEAPGAIDPGLEARIDALPAGRIELGVLDVERLDARGIDVDEGEIVELLQQEVRRIVVDVAARVIADAAPGTSRTWRRRRCPRPDGSRSRGRRRPRRRRRGSASSAARARRTRSRSGRAGAAARDRDRARRARRRT